MSWKKTEAEFDNFAEIYARFIVGDKTMSIVNPGCEAAISRLKPRSILDSACGQGRSSIALKKAGFSVHGSDISAEMIRLARANARKAQLRIPFTVAAWYELPSKISPRFDFVMCHGNAIGHCPGERSMVQSLKAIRKVTKVGGHLYLDTRSWEWFRAKSGRFWPNKSQVDENGRHTFISHATIPRKWSQPHIIEIVHVVEKGGKMKVESYPVTFYAFKISELFSRLRKAGFDKIETNYKKGMANYWVLVEAI
jgi:SAM-dependent methyltransferase